MSWAWTCTCSRSPRRACDGAAVSQARGARERNFVITTSGVEDPLALRYSIDKLGIDNVMWAIDYPYQPMAPAVAFMDQAPVSDEERRKLYHANAERIFHIAPLKRS